MRPAALIAAVLASLVLWAVLAYLYLFAPAALIAGGFVLILGLVLRHETGPNGAWARSRRASDELLQDVDERRAQRDLYSTASRSVLGTPRDWSESA